MSRLLWLSACVVFASSVARADEQTPSLREHLSQPSAKVLFLGDSITFAGQYIAVIDTVLAIDRAKSGGRTGATFYNLGLGSEGVTGLTEPDHPFPRPNVHDRLERALTKVQPDLVVACYGMNDGIYHPYSDERFAAYQDGTNKLIAAVEATGAKLVLMTPPPFDPVPVRKKLVGLDAPEFGYKTVYERYEEEVIARYAEWILAQADRVDGVVDLHRLLSGFLAAKRAEDPNYSLTGDGVHPNFNGHLVMARAILGLDETPSFEGNENKLYKLVETRSRLRRNAWLQHVGHKRPGAPKALSLDELAVEIKKLDAQIAEATENLKGS